MSAVFHSDVRHDRLALWVVAGLLFLTLLYVAWRYVGAVVLGLFVYYVTRPVFDRIYSRIGNRTMAVVVSILAVALPVLVLVTWTGVVVVEGFLELVNSQGFDQFRSVVQPYLDLTEVRDQFETLFAVILSNPGRITSIGGSGVSGVLGTLLGSLAVLFTVFIQLFIVLVITFYLLRDDYKIGAWAHDTFVPRGSVLEEYFLAVDRDLKNVYFGNILNALVTGLLGAVVYSLLNVFAPEVVEIPEPVLLGLLTGAASLIPVIGMKLVWIPVSLLLLVDSIVNEPGTVWFPAAFALVSIVVIDYIPDQLLRPYVSGRSLHVGAVMLAYIIGPLLFGWYGIFLGPLILVVVFEFARIVVPWLFHSDREATGQEPAHDRPPASTDDVLASVPTAMLAPEEGRNPGGSEEPTDG